MFGDVLIYTYYVEWQKRGLIHVLLLFWLSAKIKATVIDKIISAEVANPDVDKELYDIIVAYMVHGLCDSNSTSSCLKYWKC